MKKFFVPALSTLALAACGSNETAPSGDGSVVATDDNAMELPVASPAASGDQAFANAAAASDAFEIETSRLALEKSSSAEIKRYAKAMIDAHTKSTADLKSAGSSAAQPITPNPALTAEQQATVDRLRSATGKAFDQAYVQAQTTGHEKTLATLRDYAANGDVTELKQFGTTTASSVAAHLIKARALNA